MPHKDKSQEQSPEDESLESLEDELIEDELLDELLEAELQETSMTSMVRSSHRALIELMKITFPEKQVSEGGVCIGFASMGQQAFLTGDLEPEFRTRLSVISDLDSLLTISDFLKQQRPALIAQVKENEEANNNLNIKALEERFSKRLDIQKKLEANKRSVKWMIEHKKIQTDEEEQVLNKLNAQTFVNAYVHEKIIDRFKQLPELQRALMDMDAFLTGIFLRQNLELFPELYEDFSDRSAIASSLVTSVKLEEEGGLYEVKEASFCGVYNHKNLTDLLTSLQNHITEGLTKPISFMLGTNNHAISIGYDPNDKSWYLIDANYLPYQKISDLQTLAAQILKSFKIGHHASSEFIPINFESCVTKNNTIGQTCLKQWAESLDLKKAQNASDPIKSKALAEYKNDYLLLAAYHGRRQTVLSLLRNGADINYKNSLGDTPLNMAILQRRVDIVMDLVNAGAIVNEKGTGRNEGSSPIGLAATIGSLDLVKYLLSKNAHLRDADGVPIFHKALESPHGRNVANWLLSEGLVDDHQINELDDSQCTPLFLAIKNGYDDLIEKLLQKGADINIANTQHNITPLMLAATNGNTKLVEKLLQQGADVFLKDDLGQTVLNRAVLERRTDVIALLIKHAPQLVDEVDDNGFTPLLLAETLLSSAENDENVEHYEDNKREQNEFQKIINLLSAPHHTAHQASAKELVENYNLKETKKFTMMSHSAKRFDKMLTHSKRKSEETIIPKGAPNKKQKTTKG